MCLIIYKPNADVTVPEEHIKRSITRNNDAVGIMWAEDGKVMTDRIVTVNMEEDKILEWCLSRTTGKDSYLMHHRMSTDGKDTLDNAHPFMVLSKDDGDKIDLAMMHNGIINKCSTGRAAEMSDTLKYVVDYLQPMLEKNHELIYMEEFQEHIQSFIGVGSKLTFLDGDGTVVIVNGDAGVWRDGVWYSNTHSLYSAPAKIYRPYTGGAYKQTTPAPYSGGNKLPTPYQSCPMDDAEDDSPVVGKPEPHRSYTEKNTTTNTVGGIKDFVSAEDLKLTAWDLGGMQPTEIREWAVDLPEVLVESFQDCTYSELQKCISKLDEFSLTSVVYEMLEQLQHYKLEELELNDDDLDDEDDRITVAS